MKYIRYFVITLFAFLVFNFTVHAAGSATLSVSSTKIELGQSVTATVKITNTAAWNLSITSAGATSGCSEKFVGDSGTGLNITRSFSVTCKSTSTGIISFTLSGDITSSNGENTNVSGTKKVTVVQPTPKSSNNYLSNLSVDKGVLSPEFNKNTLEYTVEIEAGTTQIEVSAKAEDSKASVTGTGKIDVEEGLNTINIIVTAENGSQRIYIIKAIVKEFDPIVVTIDGKEFTVVRKIEDIELPGTFTVGTIEINGEAVPALYSDITNLTLVALKDQDGKIALYSYNQEKNTYTHYFETVFEQIVLYPKDMPKNLIPNGYKKTAIEIEGNTIEAYKLPGSDFALLYALNVQTNEEGLYLYDTKENTVQRYYTDEVKIIKKDLDEYNKLFLITGASAIAFGVTTVVLLISMLVKGKKSKKKRIKEQISVEI